MGKREITTREQAVWELIARGQTNREVATALGLSVSTVKRYVATLMIKLDSDNRTQLAVHFIHAEHEASGPSRKGDWGTGTGRPVRGSEGAEAGTI